MPGLILQVQGEEAMLALGAQLATVIGGHGIVFLRQLRQARVHGGLRAGNFTALLGGDGGSQLGFWGKRHAHTHYHAH